MVSRITWREIVTPVFLVISWLAADCTGQTYWFDYAPSLRNIASAQLHYPSSSSTPSPDEVLELPSVGSEAKCVDYCKRYPSCIDIAYDTRSHRCRLRLLPFDSDFVSAVHAPHHHEQRNQLHSYGDESRRSSNHPYSTSAETGHRGSINTDYNAYDHSSPSKPHTRRHAVDFHARDVGNSEYIDASEPVSGTRSQPARRSAAYSSPSKLRQSFGPQSRPYSPADGFGPADTLTNGDVDYTKYIVEPESTNGKAIFKPAILDAQYSALPSKQVGASIVVRRPKRDTPASNVFTSESLQLMCGVVGNFSDTRVGRAPKSFAGPQQPSPSPSRNGASFDFDFASTRPRPPLQSSRRPSHFPTSTSSTGRPGVNTNPNNGSPSTSLRPPLPPNHWWFQLPTSSPGLIDSKNTTKRGRREYSLHGKGKHPEYSPGSKDVLTRPFYYGSTAFRPTSNGPQSLDDRFGKIIGGTDATYGAFPWQAEIEGYSVTDRRWKHHCGGALISQQHVLTAAHCVRAKSKEYLKVRLGEHRLDTSDSHESTYRIADMVYHENHRAYGPYSNDIGILKLDKEVTFSDYVKPICLPQSNDQYVTGTWCTVTGWGLQDPKNTKSLAVTLKAARVPIISDETCKRDDVYGRRSQKILPGMLCAGFLEGGIDACGGDSGGPLSCQINGRYVALGLVSWGDGCANKDRPGVYVKVFHYLDWINKAVDSL